MRKGVVGASPRTAGKEEVAAVVAEDEGSP